MHITGQDKKVTFWQQQEQYKRNDWDICNPHVQGKTVVVDFSTYYHLFVFFIHTWIHEHDMQVK